MVCALLLLAFLKSNLPVDSLFVCTHLYQVLMIKIMCRNWTKSTWSFAENAGEGQEHSQEKEETYVEIHFEVTLFYFI